MIGEIPCNLKSIDISNSKIQILDFSQSVNEHFHTIFHIRYIFKKKSLYRFLLDHSSMLIGVKTGTFSTDIVNMLI